MKPLYLIVNNMIQELGGAEHISGKLGVSPRRVYKYGQSPNESGGQIPVDKLIALFELAGPITHNTKLQIHVNEALEHFTAPAHRKIVTDALLTDLDRFISALKDGGVWKPQHMTVECPQCTNPMLLISNDKGTQVWQCRSCVGVKLNWKEGHNGS